MNSETLCIAGVDADMLEEQRLILNKAMLEDMEIKSGKVTLLPDAVFALTGILNMLDSWSDERYYREQASNPTSEEPDHDT